MKIILAAAIAAASITGTAFAGDIDAPKGVTNTPTVMSDTQMDQIVAGNHVIRLVLQNSGLAELTSAAADATTAAGSIGAVGNDRPVIVGLLR